jgi:hypothetical protein
VSEEVPMPEPKELISAVMLHEHDVCSSINYINDEPIVCKCGKKFALLMSHTGHQLAKLNSALAPQVEAREQAAAKEMREQTLAIYTRSFEQNWVVQDVIDAINALPLPHDVLDELIRKARLDEIALFEKHQEHNGWADLGSWCCEDYLKKRKVELAASLESEK